MNGEVEFIPPQHAVAEIRFLLWFHRIDVGWPEDVEPRKLRSEECLLGLTLSRFPRQPAPPARVACSGSGDNHVWPR